MKKVVLKVELCCAGTKRKAMEAVSGLSGVNSVSVNMGDKKLTVRGDIDPVSIVGKLRKLCHTEILSVEQAKEPGKKKLDSKRTTKKPETKKEGPKKGEKKNQVAVANLLKGARPCPGSELLIHNRTHEYVHISMQERNGKKNLSIVQGVKKDFNYKKKP